MNEETLFLEWSEAVDELGVQGFGSKGHSVVYQFRGEIFDWWLARFQEREQELWQAMEEMKKVCLNCYPEDETVERKVECYGYDELHNLALTKAQSLLSLPVNK